MKRTRDIAQQAPLYEMFLGIIKAGILVLGLFLLVWRIWYCVGYCHDILLYTIPAVSGMGQRELIQPGTTIIERVSAMPPSARQAFLAYTVEGIGCTGLGTTIIAMHIYTKIKERKGNHHEDENYSPG